MVGVLDGGEEFVCMREKFFRDRLPGRYMSMSVRRNGLSGWRRTTLIPVELVARSMKWQDLPGGGSMISCSVWYVAVRLSLCVSALIVGSRGWCGVGRSIVL